MRMSSMSRAAWVGLIMFSLFKLCECNAEGVCIGSIAETSRKYLQNSAGENISINLFQGAWSSSELLTYLLRLLLEDGLGYHARIHPETGSNGASAIYGLAGCLDFDDQDKDADRRCGENETELHVSLESWLGGYENLYDSLRAEYPTLSPLDLGTIGYSGEESIYVSGKVRQTAYGDSGLALDFYRSYNTSHHDPKQYFDSLDDLPKSELKFCNSTEFMNRELISKYVEWTGDTEGVELQATGGYAAKCFDGYWWAGPACRSDTSKCLPIVTAGTGWRMHAIMNWVGVYGFPAALGVSNLWTDFTRHVRELRVLFYWWVPDSTFVDLEPSQVVFPRHSAAEWAQGNKRTSGGGTYISKMVSQGFPSQAVQVTEFLRKFTLELQEVQEMLLELARGGSLHEVSCRWIQSNEQRWRTWLPVETSCAQGFGLVDGSGKYADHRSHATSCGLCQPGTSSTALQDEVGKTYRCQPCPPGFSQPQSYSTSCEPCPKGTKSESAGSETCQPCDQGLYQNSTASSSCLVCPSERTTQLLGATSLGDCVCQENMIEVDGTCTPCREGLECPVGSTLRKLKENTAADPKHPRLQPSHFSTNEDPFEIYRCLTGCPGGAPGVCAGSRTGMTCGGCPADFFLSDGECQPCSASALTHLWWVGIATFVFVVMVAHYAMGSDYVAKASTMFCLEATVGIACVLFQNLGVLLTQVPAAWPSSSSGVLGFSELFLLHFDGLGLACFTRSIPAGFMLTSLLLILAPVAIPTLGALSNLIPWLRRRGLAWKLYKTLSFTATFLQTLFVTIVSIGMTPFMCYEHPNGEYSLVKYPDIFCGSSDHSNMAVVGIGVLCVAILFVAYYIWAIAIAPRLAGHETLAMLRFALQRFRPDMWWYGLLVLIRGLLLSFPAVVASNIPNVVVVLMFSVQLVYVLTVAWFTPWKARILNLVDCTTGGLFVLLLASALEIVEAEAATTNPLRTGAIFAMVGVMSFMLLCLVTSILVQAVFANGTQSLSGKRTQEESDTILNSLREIAKSLEGRTDDDIAKVLESLSSYDLRYVSKALGILADEGELSSARPSYSRIKSRRTVSRRNMASTKDDSMDDGKSRDGDVEDVQTRKTTVEILAEHPPPDAKTVSLEL